MQRASISKGIRTAALCLAGLCAPALADSAGDASVQFVASAEAQYAVSGEADAPLEQLLEDYDEPVISFGRAVDLAGRDIDPVGAALAPGLGFGALPSGRPLAGGRLTSGFGMRYHPTLGGNRFHGGIDIAAPAGTPVTATSAGRVSIAGWSGGYGILVSIAHGGSVETRYAHLSAVAVRPGDSVSQGQVIGYIGSTGRSTGPHLHYETRLGGRAANPALGW